MLNAPLPGQTAAQPSDAQLAAEGQSFMDAMATLGKK